MRKRCKLRQLFFRTAQTFCKHCALTIQIVMRNFPTEKVIEKKMYRTDFWSSSRGQLRKSVLYKLSSPIIKTFKIGSENLPIFSTLHVQIGKIFKKSIFSNFDFHAFDIHSWNSIKKWPRSLIFIESIEHFSRNRYFSTLFDSSHGHMTHFKNRPRTFFSLFLPPMIGKTAWR